MGNSGVFLQARWALCITKETHMKSIAGFCLLVFAAVASAGEASPDSLSTQFFESLVEGDGNKAIDGLMGTNPLMKEKTQQLQLLKSQLGTAIQIYGPASAAELVLEEDLSPSLQRRVYITKHDYHPLTWEMYFYKSKVGWLADQFLFVDQYQVIGAKK